MSSSSAPRSGARAKRCAQFTGRRPQRLRRSGENPDRRGDDGPLHTVGQQLKGEKNHGVNAERRNQECVHRWRICNEYTRRKQREHEQSIEMGKLGTDRNGGSNHALFGRGIRGRQTRKRGRQTHASRKWSRAGSEWTRSRMQRDTTRGLDRDESRYFRVSAARLAYGSGAGRAGPAAALRQVRPPDRTADGAGGPEREPQRNDYTAALQGRGEDAVWSEARMVHHPRCRRPSGGGPPWRELLQETAERRRRRTPRHASRRRDVSLRVRHRRLQPRPGSHTRP